MRQKYARATAVVMQDGKYLLVQERKRQSFSLPGGRIRQGESSSAAAKRELLEETGLKARKSTFIGNHEGRYASHHVYLLETRGEVELNRRELSNFLWWDGTDSLLLDSHVKAILQKCRDHHQRIRILMASDESEVLELKSSLRFDRKESRTNKCLERDVIRTLAAFLNGRGGTLLIGVSDDHTGVGIAADYCTFKTKPNRDGFELHLWNLIMRDLGKTVLSYISTNFHDIDGQDICQVEVKRSDSPVFMGDTKTFWLRSGNSTVQLAGDEAVNYALSHFRDA